MAISGSRRSGGCLTTRCSPFDHAASPRSLPSGSVPAACIRKYRVQAGRTEPPDVGTLRPDRGRKIHARTPRWTAGRGRSRRRGRLRRHHLEQGHPQHRRTWGVAPATRFKVVCGFEGCKWHRTKNQTGWLPLDPWPGGHTCVKGGRLAQTTQRRCGPERASATRSTIGAQ